MKKKKTHMKLEIKLMNVYFFKHETGQLTGKCEKCTCADCAHNDSLMRSFQNVGRTSGFVILGLYLHIMLLVNYFEF